MSAPTKPVNPKVSVHQTPADKRAEGKRKLRAALNAALAVPQNQHVLTELAKR